MHAFLTLGTYWTGRLHLPAFGLFAAAGLVVSMLLSQRTARLAGIDPDALWDTGMITVLAAFVLSRGLLVMANWRTFLEYPILVLALPSLTLAGMAATAIVTGFYVVHKHLPVPALLDAASPCVALLWVFLSFGSLAEGTRDGMPTQMPWGVTNTFGRVHPVEIYTAFAALILCGVLLWMLSHRIRVGEIGARALLVGGLLLIVPRLLRASPAELGIRCSGSIRVQWLGILLIASSAGPAHHGHCNARLAPVPGTSKDPSPCRLKICCPRASAGKLRPAPSTVATRGVEAEALAARRPGPRSRRR